MLFAEGKLVTKTYEDEIENPDETLIMDSTPAESTTETTEADLFQIYERIAESRTGLRDAEIFEKIHEWSFSDFTQPAHVVAGISKTELKAWQARHRINLSSGHIRPAYIDLARGHAWGTVRRNDHANGRHTQYGPPSREELIEMMGAAS